MKRKTRIFVVIAAAILIGVLIRFATVALGTLGEGRSQDSPDKKFRAYAGSVYQKRFWGGTYNHYEFRIEAISGGQQIQHIIMAEPPQGMIVWRNDGSVQWTADSSSVTYSFKGTEIQLSVKP
jgi:hypothetical protein